MRKQNKLYTANRWNQPLFAQGVDRENYNIFDGEEGSFLNTGGIGQSNFGMGNSLIAGLKSPLQLGIKDPDLRNNINNTVANSGFNPLISWGIGSSINKENPNTVDPFGIQKDFKNRTNSIVKKAQGIVDTAKSFVPKAVPTVSSRIARLAEADRLANPWNYTLDGGSTVSQYLNSTNKLGISKANNPFSKANIGDTAATAAMVAAPIANSLISDGFSTKEGEGIAGLGNAVAAGLAATGVGVVPAAIVSVASNLVGGVLNRGGGVKWNNKGKAIVEGTTQALNSSANSLASQNTNEGIMDAWGQTDFGTEFSKGDIGKDGWWGHKAKKEYRRQKQLRKEAQERARRGFTLGVENADSTMDDLAQSNFIYADGGFLDNIDFNNMGAVDFNFMSDYLLQKDRQNSLKDKMSGIPSTPIINSFAMGGPKGKKERVYSSGSWKLPSGWKEEGIRTPHGTYYRRTTNESGPDTIYTYQPTNMYSPKYMFEDSWWTERRVPSGRKTAGYDIIKDEFENYSKDAVDDPNSFIQVKDNIVDAANSVYDWVKEALTPATRAVKKKANGGSLFAIGGYKGKGEGFTGGGSSYKWKKGDSFRKAKNFNEAFDMAVAANMPEFIFNGRRYNTQKENNPVREYNNRWVGQGRRYNEKDTSEAYDRQAGPLRGPMSLIPMVTNTYNPNEDVPELEYDPNAMDIFYSPFRSYATQAPKHIVPGAYKRSDGGFLDNVFAFGGPDDPPTGTTIYREIYDPKNPQAGIVKEREFIPIQSKAVEPWEPVVSEVNKDYVPQYRGMRGAIPQGMSKEDGEYYQKVLHDYNDYPITTYSYGYKKGAYQPYKEDYGLLNVHNYPNGALGYDIRDAQGTTQYIPTKDGRWFRMTQATGEMGEPTGEYIDTLPEFDFNKYTLKSTDGENYISNPNLHAIGGDLQTNGADWSTGLTIIGAGGSHETNPNEGVQMGVDREGTPNLVEQGETVFNDYVYSTRILIDDETKRKFHIGKKREMSYADLSKKLEKESSERPNDPISQSALKAQMTQLAEEQERQKTEMQEAQAQEAFASLSPEEKQALLAEAAARRQQDEGEQQMAEQAMAEQADMQEPSPEEIAMAQQQMMADGSEPSLGTEPEGYAYGGKVNRFDDGGDVIKKAIYNALGYYTDDDFNKWAKDNSIAIGDSWDWNKALENTALIDALGKANPALAHAIKEGHYDFGTTKFPSGSRYDINTFRDILKNYTASKKQGNSSGNYAIDKNFALGNYKTIKELEQSPEYKEYTNALKGVADKLKGHKWRRKNKSISGEYDNIEWEGNEPPITKDEFDLLMALQDTYKGTSTNPNGDPLYLSETGDDGWDTVLDNTSDTIERLRNDQKGGIFHLTPKKVDRGTKVKNFLIGADGSVQEMAVDVPDGWKATNVYNWSTPEHDMTYNYFKRPVEGSSSADGTKDKDAEDEWEVTPNYKNENLRYAGLFGPLAGLGMMAAGIGKPKTGLLDASLEILNNGPALATYKPIGDYIKYRPMDIWYNQNRMDANARATDRALTNWHAPVSTRAAGLLANSYISQLGSGELYRQALEYNDNLRKQVADFNRGTNQFNAEAFNRTSLQNAEMLNRQNQLRAQMAAQVANEKMAADAGWYNSMYGNVGNLFKGISDLGRENAQHNMIAEMAADGIFGSMSPRTNTGRRGKYLTFTKRENAKGGKLNNRRK